MADQKKKSRVWEFLFIFALVYLLSDIAFKYLFPQKQQGDRPTPIVLESVSSSFRLGHHPELTLTNNTDVPYTFEDRCPKPPVDVFAVQEETGSGAVLRPLTTTETVVPCVRFDPVPPLASATISLAPWKYSLFGAPGTYEVRLQGTGATLSARFSVHEPGMIVKAFRTFITKPFLNFLILVASALPDHNLGVAIIVLTLLVKLLLYFPTQHAMEGQRKMQLIQPRIQELQKRFSDDPQKLHQETMKLWREEKVNPFQSLLPLILQFPILIGLFFVIRDGSDLALSREFIYPFYQDLSWNFSTWFLGLDLTKMHWLFAPVLFGLQFGQMYLSFQSANKKAQPQDTSQKVQQRVMLVAMPLLIGFFAFQFPAAVSLYWGVSTLFAIGQQWVVNRKVG